MALSARHAAVLREFGVASAATLHPIGNGLIHTTLLVSINGEAMSPAQLLTRLNELGGKHGIGRIDLVENRLVGMKSRGVYETPGGTILLHGHRQMETLTMDRDLMHLRDRLAPEVAEIAVEPRQDVRVGGPVRRLVAHGPDARVNRSAR